MIERNEISELCIAAMTNVRQVGQVEVPLEERPFFISYLKSGETDGRPVFVTCSKEESTTSIVFQAKNWFECPEAKIGRGSDKGTYVQETDTNEDGNIQHTLFLIMNNDILKYVPKQEGWSGPNTSPYPPAVKVAELNQIADAFQSKNIVRENI